MEIQEEKPREALTSLSAGSHLSQGPGQGRGLGRSQTIFPVLELPGASPGRTGPEGWDTSFTDAHLPHPQVLWPVGPERGGAQSEENDEPVVLGADMGQPGLLVLFSQQILTKTGANWPSSLSLPPQPILSLDLLKCYGPVATLSATHCDPTVSRLHVFLIGLSG